MSISSASSPVAVQMGLTDSACIPVCQCDGQYIPLPSLQGIAVLNIPSYAGGTNFWGGTKEDDVSTLCGVCIQNSGSPAALGVVRKQALECGTMNVHKKVAKMQQCLMKTAAD